MEKIGIVLTLLVVVLQQGTNPSLAVPKETDVQESNSIYTSERRQIAELLQAALDNLYKSQHKYDIGTLRNNRYKRLDPLKTSQLTQSEYDSFIDITITVADKLWEKKERRQKFHTPMYLYGYTLGTVFLSPHHNLPRVKSFWSVPFSFQSEFFRKAADDRNLIKYDLQSIGRRVQYYVNEVGFAYSAYKEAVLAQKDPENTNYKLLYSFHSRANKLVKLAGADAVRRLNKQLDFSESSVEAYGNLIFSDYKDPIF